MNLLLPILLELGYLFTGVHLQVMWAEFVCSCLCYNLYVLCRILFSMQFLQQVLLAKFCRQQILWVWHLPLISNWGCGGFQLPFLFVFEICIAQECLKFVYILFRLLVIFVFVTLLRLCKKFSHLFRKFIINDILIGAIVYFLYIYTKTSRVFDTLEEYNVPGVGTR